MRIFLSIISFLLLTNIFCAQAQNFVWAQRYGNVKSDKATTVRADKLGNVYICGYFSTSITLGTNALPLNYQYNQFSKEVILAKFDSTGFCLWAKSAGETFDDRALGMDVDSAGNATITGTFWQTSTGLQFSGGNVITGTGFGGGDQCFIARFDPNGNYVWGKCVSSDGGDDQGYDVKTDKWGNLYATGFTSGAILHVAGAALTVNNPNSVSGGGWNFWDNAWWVAKFDPAGNPLWAHVFGRQPKDSSHNKYVERDNALTVDNEGSVYLAGGFDYNPFFTPTLTKQSLGRQDVYVIKYDSSGAFKWVQTGGSRDDDWANGISADNLGNVYVVGEHRDSLLFDTIITKNYNKRDVFVMKLDAKTGAGLWGARAGSQFGSERANDVFADDQCNVYVCGDINIGAKFGDNLTTPNINSVQGFVAKINPNGKWKWVITGGGTDSNDRCNSIIKGIDNNLYTCGYFRSPTIYGGIPLTSVGSSDAFYARMQDSFYNKTGTFAFTRPKDTVLCPLEKLYVAIPAHNYFAYYPATGVVPNADTSVLTFSPTTTTTYTLVGYEGIFCPQIDSMVFTVIAAPLPIVSIILNPNNSQLLKDSIKITAQNNTPNTATQVWSLNNNIVGNAGSYTNTFYTPNFGQKCFSLSVTTTQGCVDSAIVCVDLIAPTNIHFANAFSPNGDANNPDFGPDFYYTDLSLLKNYKFIIMARNGTMVFSSNNPLEKWKGNFANGGKAPMDTYFYSCTFENASGKSKSYKGDVLLME